MHSMVIYIRTLDFSMLHGASKAVKNHELYSWI